MHPRRLWMDNEYSSVQFDTNNKRLTLITRVISRLFNSKLLTPKLYYFVMRKYQRLKILIWFPIEIVLINIGRCFFFFFVQFRAMKISDEKQSCSPPSFLFLLIISIDNFPSMDNKRLINEKFAIDWKLSRQTRVQRIPTRRLFSTIVHPFIVITYQLDLDSSKWWIFFVPSSKVK